MAGQCVEDLLVALFSAKRIEEDDRPVHLRINVDGGDRDEIQILVIDGDQFLGDHLSERLVEPRFTRITVLTRCGGTPLGLFGHE